MNIGALSAADNKDILSITYAEEQPLNKRKKTDIECPTYQKDARWK